MTKAELKYCPECGTKTLEVEEGFTKTHCANCGNWFTCFMELGRGFPRKGFLLTDNQNEKNTDPNYGKTELQIAKTNPGIRDHRDKK